MTDSGRDMASFPAGTSWSAQQLSILSLLTDAHCHPTDDPSFTSRGREDVQKLAARLERVPLGGVCAMSSCTEDQVLVRELAEEMQRRRRAASGSDDVDGAKDGTHTKLRPCFGYHPWYSHTISTASPSSALDHEQHYRSLLLTSDSSQRAKDELEALLPHLPPPRSLEDILEELRTNLRSFPDALLGEVGLDRAFRIPARREAMKEEAEEQTPLGSDPVPSSSKSSEASNSHTLALRGKRLTTLGVPIGHQVKILLAQVGVAVEEGRSISCHSVRAGEATIDFIRECCRVYNGANGRGFRDINLDLHSCTMSAEQLKEILRHHPNIYLSYSTAINSRQKSLLSQLEMIPPTRMLVESDWHGAEDLAARNWDMLRVLAPFVNRKEVGEEVGLKLELGLDRQVEGGRAGREEVSEEEMHLLLLAGSVLKENWERFEMNNVKRAIEKNNRCRRDWREQRGTDGDGSDDDDDDEQEELEWQRRMDFEEQWWKDVRAGALRRS